MTVKKEIYFRVMLDNNKTWYQGNGSKVYNEVKRVDINKSYRTSDSPPNYA